MVAERRVLVFFGMIATGKSYLAEAWARRQGCAYYNSDRVRKELAGLAPESRQPAPVNQGIYRPELSRATYDKLLDMAERELEVSPHSCVALDGSYQARDERERVRKRLTAKARLLFVHCLCPEEVMRERMEQRQQDPLAVSDGRWEIYLQQKARFEMPIELGPEQLLTINTNQPVDALLGILDEWIGRLPVVA